MRRKEIAAFAYELTGKRLKLVLVTNREKTHWILPKGQPETHLSDPEVALMEAYEEGGLIGKLDKRFTHYSVQLQGTRGRVDLRVYVMRIDKLLDDWPEAGFRKRKLVDVDTALSKVDKAPLRECIEKLSTRILRNRY